MSAPAIIQRIAAGLPLPAATPPTAETDDPERVEWTESGPVTPEIDEMSTIEPPPAAFMTASQEMTPMSENPLEEIERLERLAAWHRINAERAGAAWVWEARLRTAEDLERQAAKMRAQMADDPWTTQS
jgi:hypothetical protein